MWQTIEGTFAQLYACEPCDIDGLSRLSGRLRCGNGASAYCRITAATEVVDQLKVGDDIRAIGRKLDEARDGTSLYEIDTMATGIPEDDASFINSADACRRLRSSGVPGIHVEDRLVVIYRRVSRDPLMHWARRRFLHSGHLRGDVTILPNLSPVFVGDLPRLSGMALSASRRHLRDDDWAELAPSSIYGNALGRRTMLDTPAPHIQLREGQGRVQTSPAVVVPWSLGNGPATVWQSMGQEAAALVTPRDLLGSAELRMLMLAHEMGHAHQRACRIFFQGEATSAKGSGQSTSRLKSEIFADCFALGLFLADGGPIQACENWIVMRSLLLMRHPGTVPDSSAYLTGPALMAFLEEYRDNFGATSGIDEIILTAASLAGRYGRCLLQEHGSFLARMNLENRKETTSESLMRSAEHAASFFPGRSPIHDHVKCLRWALERSYGMDDFQHPEITGPYLNRVERSFIDLAADAERAEMPVSEVLTTCALAWNIKDLPLRPEVRREFGETKAAALTRGVLLAPHHARSQLSTGGFVAQSNSYGRHLSLGSNPTCSTDRHILTALVDALEDLSNRADDWSPMGHDSVEDLRSIMHGIGARAGHLWFSKMRNHAEGYVLASPAEVQKVALAWCITLPEQVDAGLAPRELSAQLPALIQTLRHWAPTETASVDMNGDIPPLMAAHRRGPL